MIQKCDTSLIQEVTWDDVREKVHQVDKTLANLIDQINPSKKYKLLKVNYSYGDLILKDGILQLPVKKKIVVAYHRSRARCFLERKIGL